ncbi:hypothetical protein [Lactiplantibacillus argentoratensis]|uniref:hypothetical protein n=1 Tax=Lactiplantibacillus argentoratensis TaxID=271881 RepID=UPI0021AAD746|nr:hypothetical protein [Lactiplantibacillus argentoratensis]
MNFQIKSDPLKTTGRNSSWHQYVVLAPTSRYFSQLLERGGRRFESKNRVTIAGRSFAIQAAYRNVLGATEACTCYAKLF